MKKRSMLIIISTIILVISVFGIYSFASFDNKGAAIGNVFKKYKVDKDAKDDKILAKAGDIEITKNDVDYQKGFFKASGID